LSDALHRGIGALDAALAPRLADAGADWLRAAREEVSEKVEAVFRYFPAAGRRVGRRPLVEPASERPTRLFGDDGPILDAWKIEDAARAILILESALVEPVEPGRRLADLYLLGSAAERVSALRTFQFFPEGEIGLPCVRDALRANAVDLFAAAICENLYASKHLPDPLFFQATLKCVFVGLDLRRIEGLRGRTTPELSRMLYAYVTEREQAGRPVAPELWPLIALHPPPGAENRPEVARLSAGR